MGAPDVTTLPPASTLQTFLESHPPPADSPHTPALHNLALQIAHNLRYQHLWTEVCLHLHASHGDVTWLPRPVVSGVPPQRLYIHPDEQVELLQEQKDQGKIGMPELRREREWVLPSHLREKWTLRRFGETFDCLATVPPRPNGEGDLLFGDVEEDEKVEASPSTWREKLPKRLLLATLDDDSTVVYYIVHDGIVKPRQN